MNLLLNLSKRNKRIRLVFFFSPFKIVQKEELGKKSRAALYCGAANSHMSSNFPQVFLCS